MGQSLSYMRTQSQAYEIIENWEVEEVSFFLESLDADWSERFARHLKDNRSTRLVLLDRCGCGGDAGLKPLFSVLSQNTNHSLYYLSLAGNDLGEKTAQEIIEIIEKTETRRAKNESLLWIDLDDNPNISSNSIDRIQDILTQRRTAYLQSLSHLKQPQNLNLNEVPLTSSSSSSSSHSSSLSSSAAELRSGGSRVLVLDGGGIRALSQLHFLKALEASTGKPIASLFDMIVGNGSGGVIAIALALAKLSIDQTIDLFSRISSQVYGVASAGDGIKGAFNTQIWGSAWYEHAKLLPIFQEVFDKNTKLSDLMADENNGKSRVCIIAAKDSGTPQPAFFRNYSSKKFTDASLVDLAMVCMSTPGFFDPYPIGKNKFVEGSITSNNNPIHLAFKEVKSLWPDRPINLLLSIGSGSLAPPPTGKINWNQYRGITNFTNVLPKLIVSSEAMARKMEQMTPLYSVQDQPYPIEYIRINVPLSAEIRFDEPNPENLKKIKDQSYHYIQQRQRPQALEMSSPSNVSSSSITSTSTLVSSAPHGEIRQILDSTQIPHIVHFLELSDNSRNLEV